MKKRLNLFIIIVLWNVVASCGIFGGHNLAKRFRNTNNVNMFRKATDPQSFVRVEATSYVIRESKTPDPKYNVLTLNREGQAQFIKSLQEKFADPKEFMKQFNTNFKFLKKPDETTRIIPKSIKKSIVFTVGRLQYDSKDTMTTVFNLPGDRVSFLELSLKIPIDSTAKFDSWDKFVTENLTLNLGKVSSAQQWSANVNVAAQANIQTSLSGSNTKTGLDTSSQVVVVSPVDALGNTNTSTTTNGSGNSNTTGTGLTKGVQLGGSAGLTYSDSYNTSVDLSSRILKLSGTLSPKKLVLRQESGPGIDLNGNVVVSVTYELTNDWAKPANFIKFDDLYNDNGSVKEFRDLKIKTLTVIFPDLQADVLGNLDYDFLYRQVIHGNRHIPEARQKVRFYYGSVKNKENKVLDCKPIVLVKKEDIRPKAYVIYSGISKLTFAGKEVQFESVDDAMGFVHYLGDLLQMHNSVPGITINGTILNSDLFANIQIKTINL